ncbi:hypothetical protein R6242_10145 [Iodobacter sp. CM08]|uniref:hypothetical protein n=1 Tax=Iodobacter sp. CM08 TaxID=3085902 RepID=UPI0029810624|nr:hypothetical protein [Iodobacter sp. CM08]MDW5416926.1 hypothetical protein [Iodobacter sp. CM08]
MSRLVSALASQKRYFYVFAFCCTDFSYIWVAAIDMTYLKMIPKQQKPSQVTIQ